MWAGNGKFTESAGDGGIYILIPTFWKTETRGLPQSLVQSGLHSEFQISPGYRVSLCLIK